MWSYNYTSQNELYHHGIKGQKWGVRRYQYNNGRWTAEGKIRYGSGHSTKRYGASESAASTSTKKTKPVPIDHHKEDDPAGLVTANIMMMTFHALTLNPIGITKDVIKIVDHIAAKSNEKKVLSKMADADVDKKTGLPLKNKEMTDEEDLGYVNPAFRNFYTNTKNNCMLCTTTFDLRKRGFDVTAEKAQIGYTPDDLKNWYPKAKVKDSKGYENLKNDILAQGEGARGNLMVDWKMGGGHSMVYTVKNGNFVVYDAQSNTVYNNPQKVLKQATDNFQYARLDNVQPNYKKIKECVRTK